MSNSVILCIGFRDIVWKKQTNEQTSGRTHKNAADVRPIHATATSVGVGNTYQISWLVTIQAIY